MSDEIKSLVARPEMTPQAWQVIMAQAPVVAVARMFGMSEQQVAVVMGTAHELGLPPMASLNGLLYAIDTQNGKRAALSTAGMSTLIQQSGVMSKVTIEDHSDKNGEPCGCTVHMERRDGTMSGSVSFMRADAERAGLLSKANWKNYPRDMYYARAYSGAARRYGNDACFGLHTADELGAVTDRDGAPMTVDAPYTVSKPSPATPAQAFKAAFNPTQELQTLVALGFTPDRIMAANGGKIPATKEELDAVLSKLSDEDNKAALEKQKAK